MTFNDAASDSVKQVGHGYTTCLRVQHDVRERSHTRRFPDNLYTTSTKTVVYYVTYSGGLSSESAANALLGAKEECLYDICRWYT